MAGIRLCVSVFFHHHINKTWHVDRANMILGDLSLRKRVDDIISRRPSPSRAGEQLGGMGKRMIFCLLSPAVFPFIITSLFLAWAESHILSAISLSWHWNQPMKQCHYRGKYKSVTGITSNSIAYTCMSLTCELITKNHHIWGINCRKPPSP